MQLLHVALVDRHINQIIIFGCLVKDTAMQTEKPLMNDHSRAHLGEGSRGSGPLPFFQTYQTVPSKLASKSQ